MDQMGGRLVGLKADHSVDLKVDPMEGLKMGHSGALMEVRLVDLKVDR